MTFQAYLTQEIAAAEKAMKAEIVQNFTREEAVEVLIANLKDAAVYLRLGDVDGLVKLQAIARVLAAVESDFSWKKMTEARI